MVEGGGEDERRLDSRVGINLKSVKSNSPKSVSTLMKVTTQNQNVNVFRRPNSLYLQVWQAKRTSPYPARIPS